MQTFMLDMDFTKSAKLLDNVRLNKQSMECHQIYRVLMGQSQAWVNHPVVKMWDKNVVSFLSYCYTIAIECERRNIKSPYAAYFKMVGVDNQNEGHNPIWLDDDFISRHRSALLFKTAIKTTVYDFSLLREIPVIDVHQNNEFIKFINRHNEDFYLKSEDILKQYPVGKPIYKHKSIATMPMITRAYRDYHDYKVNFGDIPHKIDYRWG
jgi:hypothetical protein